MAMGGLGYFGWCLRLSHDILWLVSGLCGDPVPPSFLSSFITLAELFLFCAADRFSFGPSMLVLGAFFHGLGPVCLDGYVTSVTQIPSSLLTFIRRYEWMNNVTVPLPLSFDGYCKDPVGLFITVCLSVCVSMPVSG